MFNTLKIHKNRYKPNTLYMLCVFLQVSVIMLLNKKSKKFKSQFRHIIFYSFPPSIMYIVRKRFNFVLSIVSFILISVYSFM